MTITRYLYIATIALSSTACSTVTVTDYSDLQPPMVLERFFNGNLSAHGVVKDRNGRVIRMFNASIGATWNDGIGTLDEEFIFDNGEEQQRIWQLEPQEDGSYTGTAGDVQGEGKLTLAGNSVFLDYILEVPYGDGTIDVRVDDRMYLVSPGILLNESQLTKFGVHVGSIVLVILQKDPQLAHEQQPAQGTTLTRVLDNHF